MRRSTIFLLTLLACSLVALAYRSEVQAWMYDTGRAARKQIGKVAPEIPKDVKTVEGSALTLESLRGKVVVVHFWTFACDNCKRMIPVHNSLHSRFAAKGLAVVGIHTPELDFERSVKLLREFIGKEKIEWPVLLDPDYSAWQAYKVDAWPTALVIDRKGMVRGVFVGDNQAHALEKQIAGLL